MVFPPLSGHVPPACRTVLRRQYYSRRYLQGAPRRHPPIKCDSFGFRLHDHDRVIEQPLGAPRQADGRPPGGHREVDSRSEVRTSRVSREQPAPCVRSRMSSAFSCASMAAAPALGTPAGTIAATGSPLWVRYTARPSTAVSADPGLLTVCTRPCRARTSPRRTWRRFVNRAIPVVADAAYNHGAPVTSGFGGIG